MLVFWSISLVDFVLSARLICLPDFCCGVASSVESFSLLAKLSGLWPEFSPKNSERLSKPSVSNIISASWFAILSR